ncbi:D-amino acid aminotransferase [Rheinheimera sp. 1928-s]|uniref:D-amino acid aminotransferase n=1 Tax=Rheinheimera sp. 1928-s TaxID=3033803 RepID=UPI00261612BE|nr:D-amino acid aminotransferase [Rheinheimera sp. 1928-s]MDF3127144.1 D-amino acid aminotransferase [Rheinheimera sp. 1928-s]
MSVVYLNGQFMPAEDAKISPMDRGFLFGDGIYEVIPSYAGLCVGFAAHIERLQQGLAALEIRCAFTAQDWKELVQQLIQQNGAGNLGIYLHVSRGTDSKRAHAYPQDISPTIFAYCFDIAAEPEADIDKAPRYKVMTATDLRWQRCQIKSTALLGNVMHHQQAAALGLNECILFDEQGFLTEGSSTNVFIVKNDVVITPPLSHQILPGITRQLLLSILRQHSRLEVEERAVTKDEVLAADEVWLTSSSKEVAAVIEVDGKAIGSAEPGPVWWQAQQLFSRYKYSYS